MVNKEDLLKYPNYLLTTYQLDIYKQLMEYKKERGLTQKQIAKELGVTTGYVSQILNGDFNFTLKKLIELGLYVGKVPHIEWVNVNEYWKKVNQSFESVPKIHFSLNVFSRNLLSGNNYGDASVERTISADTEKWVLQTTNDTQTFS